MKQLVLAFSMLMFISFQSNAQMKNSASSKPTMETKACCSDSTANNQDHAKMMKNDMNQHGEKGKMCENSSKKMDMNMKDHKHMEMKDHKMMDMKEASSSDKPKADMNANNMNKDVKKDKENSSVGSHKTKHHKM